MDNDKAEITGEPSPKRRRTSSACIQRPNFFVAVQISNPEIHREISVLQKFITTKKPLFKSTLIKLITLHITLCTLHLPNNGDIKRAKSALKTLESSMKESLIENPISLKFKGIGSFKNEVVFAKIESGEPLTRFKGLHINLVEALEKEGLIVKDKFEPHLTIMKMSKDRHLRKKKIFKIPKELYEEHNEMLFGDQTVKGVQLLKMGYRSPEEYYQCYHQFDLGIDDNEPEDHQHCCGVKSVLPSSLIEINPDSSDEETEEMFYDAKEVLDEALDLEESEMANAQKYLHKFEVKKEVFYDTLDYVAEKANVKVEEVCSRAINMKRKKVQNKRLKHRRYKLNEAGMSVESSTSKVKMLEIEEDEDLGLKFLLEEMEVEDVKVSDNSYQLEEVKPGQRLVEDGTREGQAESIETNVIFKENSGYESTALPNQVTASSGKTVKITKCTDEELEDLGLKFLPEDSDDEDVKMPSVNLSTKIVDVSLPQDKVRGVDTPVQSTINGNEGIGIEKSILGKDLDSSHNESNKVDGSKSEEMINSPSEIEKLKLRLEMLKHVELKESKSEKNILQMEEVTEKSDAKEFRKETKNSVENN